jgi:7,8-dihydropterin-6-yl-methyl-4-(beta-D-ribofuranosyl)aminobenzene 5'-phosphate synthase
VEAPTRISASVLLLVVLISAVSGASAVASDIVAADSTKAEVSMITIYDNYQHDPNLETGWGFSCLVEADGIKLLFDTGAEGSLLLENMEKLGINAKEIDAAVLSHAHGDHTGGLDDFLEANSNVKLYLLKSSPNSFKEKVKSSKAQMVEVSDPVAISERMSTTGELGTSIKEQSLVVKTGKGLVVITGCAHPGILNILRHAKRITGEDIYLVLGGFHLLDKSEIQLKEVIKGFRELGVKKVAPCHCSGEQTRTLFEKEYKEDFIANGVGNTIQL